MTEDDSKNSDEFYATALHSIAAMNYKSANYESIIVNGLKKLENLPEDSEQRDLIIKGLSKAIDNIVSDEMGMPDDTAECDKIFEAFGNIRRGIVQVEIIKDIPKWVYSRYPDVNLEKEIYDVIFG